MANSIHGGHASKVPNKPSAPAKTAAPVAKAADAPAAKAADDQAALSDHDRDYIKKTISSNLHGLSGMGREVEALEVKLDDKPIGNILGFDAFVRTSTANDQPVKSKVSEAKGGYDMKSKSVNVTQMPELPE